MYTGDTGITISSNSQAELIERAQASLVNIAEWMRTDKLNLNFYKNRIRGNRSSS